MSASAEQSCDKYFYGGNRSYEVVENFHKAFLFHMHRNPHHWQYWILTNDSADQGEKLIEMPYEYVVEMICDWWSFSWKSGNLYEIFDWYHERLDHIKLHSKTRLRVNRILEAIYAKLEAEE